MTILKNFILSFAIAPLTISMAFAIGGNDPIPGIDIIVKRPAVSQANIERPTTVQETRQMKRQVISPLMQLNPIRPATAPDQFPQHDETDSRCYVETHHANNMVTVNVVEGCHGALLTNQHLNKGW